MGDIFLAHLCTLVPIEHRLNATAYLSIVADHVHPFMTTVYPSSDGYFQQDNAPCHKAQIISDWFLEHDNEFQGSYGHEKPGKFYGHGIFKTAISRPGKVLEK